MNDPQHTCRPRPRGRTVKPCSACFRVIERSGFRRGAAVAFGLMGMAEAIRNRRIQRRFGTSRIVSRPGAPVEVTEYSLSPEAKRGLMLDRIKNHNCHRDGHSWGHGVCIYCGADIDDE